jgi:hypothetical protein
VKSTDLNLVTIGFVVASLIIKGILVRLGTWSASQWILFVLQLAASAGLVVLSQAMAGEVDHGIMHGWTSGMRLAYVMTMILMGLYGAFSGLWLLSALSGGNAPAQTYNNMLIAFVVLTLALGAAAWLTDTAGISFQQSGAIILGFFSLCLGTHTPEWVRLSYRYRVLSDIIGDTAVRVFYGAVGLTLIGFGILGRAHIFQ